MIYIDPPYNTGKDFVYEDDFADPMARYKEVTQQTTKSNPETMGRFHTNWLNMMYPRLRLAANLLRDDGVIFISIDDNEVDNLKKLCNEVLGEENFVAQLIWERAFSPKNDAKFLLTAFAQASKTPSCPSTRTCTSQNRYLCIHRTRIKACLYQAYLQQNTQGTPPLAFPYWHFPDPLISHLIYQSFLLSSTT